MTSKKRNAVIPTEGANSRHFPVIPTEGANSRHFPVIPTEGAKRPSGGIWAWAVVCCVVLVSATSVPAVAGDLAHLQGLGDTRYHRLESKAADHTYHVYVRLPEGYAADGDRRYPTVYLLDGGTTYPLLAAYSRYLEFAEEIPDTILVGISYGTDDWENGNNRSHDYTAPSTEREFWGGAADFQSMLRDELLPLIESTYRSDPTRRVIFGQSLGGQFVLFTALTDPALFWGHIASNPALHRNLPFFLVAPEPSKTDGRSKLFVASGSDDDPEFREPALAWIEFWSQRTTTPWALMTVTLDDHGHFSALPAAFRQGMTWLFEVP